MCKPEVLEAYYGTDVIKLNEDLIVPVNKGSSVLYSYVTSPNIRHLTLLDENCEKISQMFKKKKRKNKKKTNKPACLDLKGIQSLLHPGTSKSN